MPVEVPNWFAWEVNRGVWKSQPDAQGGRSHTKSACCQGVGCRYPHAANAVGANAGEQLVRIASAGVPVTGAPASLGPATFLCPGCAAAVGVCVKCGAASVLGAKSFRGLCLDCEYYGDEDDNGGGVPTGTEGGEAERAY